MNEVSNSMIERPYSNGLHWFIILLVVLFFIGFYSVASTTTYIPNNLQIESGEPT